MMRIDRHTKSKMEDHSITIIIIIIFEPNNIKKTINNNNILIRIYHYDDNDVNNCNILYYLPIYRHIHHKI